MFVPSYSTANLETVDISDIKNPVSVAQTALNTTGYYNDAQILGKYLYLAGTVASTIVDTSNPLAPTQVTSSLSALFNISVVGKYLYGTLTGTSGVNVYDIASPSSPILLGVIPTNLSPTGIYVSDRYGYVVNTSSPYALQIFDLGGTYSQTFESGTVETTTARINNDASIGGSLSLQGGLTVAGASLLDGDISINGAAIYKNKVNSTTALQIQNAAGTSFFTADSTNSSVTVTNLVVGGVAGATLTVNGHIISGNASGTTSIVAGAAACTTPTVSLTGNDTAGTITITTGTGCATTGTLATITFGGAYTAAPKVIITPRQVNASNLQVYANPATGNFVLGTNTVPTNSTQYRYNYLIIQ